MVLDVKRWRNPPEERMSLEEALEKVTQKVVETRKELIFLEGELEKAGAKIKDVE